MSQPLSQMTTAEITTACQELLTSLGHTNVKAEERWEGDGVFQVWSDQTTIEVTGTDNIEAFEPGATVRFDDEDPDYDEGIQADSMGKIREILVTR